MKQGTFDHSGQRGDSHAFIAEILATLKTHLAGDSLQVTADERRYIRYFLGQQVPGVHFHFRQVSREEVQKSRQGINITALNAEEQGVLLQSPDLGRFGISLPDGNVYIPSTARTGPLRSIKMFALVCHEYYHQIQYAVHGREKAFNRLIREGWDKSSGAYDPYDYRDRRNFIGKENAPALSRFDELTALESEAALIERFVLLFLKDRRAEASFRSETAELAMILKKGGFSSQAVGDVLR